ncbi:MAG TPA: hypothetical protein ENH84_05005 [Phycisphaerae bacterium]|nr:hypothetical protein [Phycisphaerae bacterium]
MKSLLRKLSRLGRIGVNRRFLAVDFDTRQLRIAQVDRLGSRPRLRKFHTEDISETLDLQDPSQIGEFFSATLKRQRIARSAMIMNVPRGQAVLKPLHLPPGTDRDEIAGMVRFQVQGELPFPAEEGILDFTVEGESSGQEESDGLDVLAAAIRQPVLDFYKRLAEAAGLKLYRLGLRPYANARCIEACSACSEGRITAVVHITADETEIDVMEGNRLVFSRSAVVKVPPPDLLTDEERKENIDTVTAEVVRTMQGFLAIRHGSSIDLILVAGGTGIERGVAEMLGQLQQLRCELFNPAESLGLKDVEDASGYLSVIGLAFGSRGAEKAPFDFLHPKRPAVKRDPRQQRKIAIALGALIALFVMVGGSWSYLGAKAGTLKALQRTKREEEKKETSLRGLIRRVSTIDDWVEGGVGWLDHWLILSSVLPDARDVYIDDLRTNETKTTIKVHTPDDMIVEQKMKGSFIFTVHARDSEIIAKLVQDLREDGYTIKAGRDGQDANSYGYVRHIEVRVFIPSDKELDVKNRKAPPRPKDDDIDAPLDRVKKKKGDKK